MRRIPRPAFLLFAALAFVFPLSMGLVVVASPLWGADAGLGEGYIGLVLGGNSLIVAALAVPLAARIEPLGPFQLLGAAAFVVACGIACYAVVPGAAAAYLAGTVMFSFGELVFSSAVPAAVARLAPAGRRGAYQGAGRVASFSMGSALFVSGLLRDAIGWRGAWLVFWRSLAPQRCFSFCVAGSLRRQGFEERNEVVDLRFREPERLQDALAVDVELSRSARIVLHHVAQACEAAVVHIRGGQRVAQPGNAELAEVAVLKLDMPRVPSRWSGPGRRCSGPAG